MTVGGALGGLVLSGVGRTGVAVLGSVMAALTLISVRQVLPRKATTPPERIEVGYRLHSALTEIG